MGDEFKPYVGPRPFETREQDRFFGRDAEAEQLLSMVSAYAAVLLYAQSGAGKTSLINAKLKPRLEEEGFEVQIGRLRTNLTPNRQAANTFVFNLLVSLIAEQRAEKTDTAAFSNARPEIAAREVDSLAKMSVAAFIKSRPAADSKGFSKPRLIIIDQCEELFTLNREHWEERHGFFEQISIALSGTPPTLKASDLIDPNLLFQRLGDPGETASNYLRRRFPELAKLGDDYQARISRRRGSVTQFIKNFANPKELTQGDELDSLVSRLLEQLNRIIQSRTPLHPNPASPHGTAQPSLSNGIAEIPAVFREVFEKSQSADRSRIWRWALEAAFPNAIAASVPGDPNLRILFSMREEYVASMDPYGVMLPDQLRNRFRLELLSRSAALAAITEPLKKTRRHFGEGVAEELVSDLLRTEVKDIDGNTTTITEEYVDSVQLAIVCENLWDELALDVDEISMRQLKKSGDVRQALIGFYNKCVSEAFKLGLDGEGKIRRWCQETLITSAGTRAPVFRDEEKGKTGGEAGLNNETVDRLEEKHLIRREMRGTSPWFELSHDRFIGPIRSANQTWFREFDIQKPLRKALESQAEKYAQSKSRKDLLRGYKLKEAQEWRASSDASEVGYSKELDKLIAESESAAKQRGIARGALVLLAVASLAAVVIVALYHQHQKQQRALSESADRETAIALGTVASELMQHPDQDSPFPALVIAIRAVAPRPRTDSELKKPRPQPPKEAEDALNQAVDKIGDSAWLRGIAGSIKQVELSPDGKLALIVTEREISVWDASTGQFFWLVQPRIAKSEISTARIQRAAAKSIDSAPAKAPTVKPNWARAAFAGNGSWVVAQLEPPPESYNIPQNSPAQIARVAPPQPLEFFDSRTGSELPYSMTRPRAGETFAGLSSELGCLVFVDAHGGVRLVSGATEAQSITLPQPVDALRMVHVSKSGKFAITAGKSGVGLWHLNNGSLIKSLAMPVSQAEAVHAVRFSRDEQRFALWSHVDDDVNRQNAWMRRLPTPNANKSSPVDAATPDTSTTIWSSNDGHLVSTLESDTVLGQILFNDDGSKVAGITTTARIWDAATGKQLPGQEGWHAIPLRDPFRDPSSRHGWSIRNDLLLITGSIGDVGQLLVWDPFSGAIIARCQGPWADRQVAAAATSDWTNGRRTLARVVVGDGGLARVWDMNTRSPNATASAWPGPLDRAWAQLQYQPESSRYFSAYGNELPATANKEFHPALSDPMNTGTRGSSAVETAKFTQNVSDLLPPPNTEADAKYAAARLHEWLGIDVEFHVARLFDSANQGAFWMSDDKTIYISPGVKDFPDLVYWQVAHAFILSVWPGILATDQDESQSWAIETSYAQIATVMIKQSKQLRETSKDWEVAPGYGGPRPAASLKEPENADFAAISHVRALKQGNPYNDRFAYAGIPNKAFYEAAIHMGDNGIAKARTVWFEALKNLPRKAQFSDVARITQEIGAQEYGKSSNEFLAIRNAWKSVGVAADSPSASQPASRPVAPVQPDSAPAPTTAPTLR